MVQSEIMSVLSDCHLVEWLKGPETRGGMLRTAGMGEVWLDLDPKHYRSMWVFDHLTGDIGLNW